MKIKIPWGRGGSYILSGWGGGVRCVPSVFAFIQSQSFWAGQAPQTPHIPNDTANNIKYSKNKNDG